MDSDYMNDLETPRPSNLNVKPYFSYYTRPFRMSIRITDEQKRDLLEAFNLFDVEGRGKVTTTDLRVAIRALGFEVQNEDVRKLKESTNICVGIDILSFQNFLELMEAKMLQQDDTEDLIKYFNLVDQNGTGRLHFKKLKVVAEALGQDESDEILHEMLTEIGTDDIRLDDFLRFIKNTTLRLQELFNKRQ